MKRGGGGGRKTNYSYKEKEALSPGGGKLLRMGSGLGEEIILIEYVKRELLSI